MVTATRMTIEQVEALPEREQRLELYGGVPRPVMAPLYDHGKAVVKWASLLDDYARLGDLGDVVTEVGFVFAEDPDTLLLPDIAFVRADRRPAPAARARSLRMAPDLACEVLSPTNTATDVAEKIEIYLRGGVRLVWIGDPRRRTVTVHTPDHIARTLFADDLLDGGDVLPGLRLRVGDIFA